MTKGLSIDDLLWEQAILAHRDQIIQMERQAEQPSFFIDRQLYHLLQVAIRDVDRVESDGPKNSAERPLRMIGAVGNKLLHQLEVERTRVGSQRCSSLMSNTDA